MKLGRKKPRMILDLYDLNEVFLGIESTDDQPIFYQDISVDIVEFIPVAVPLRDLDAFVGLISQRVRHQDAWIGSKPHRGPLVHLFLTRHNMDDRIRGLFIKLRTIGVNQTSDIPCKFDNCTLHSQAYTKKRNPVLPCKSYGLDLSFDPPAAESARDKDALDTGERQPRIFILNLFCIRPLDIHGDMICDPSMRQCLTKAFVGILEIYIFPNNGNLHSPHG